MPGMQERALSTEAVCAGGLLGGTKDNRPPHQQPTASLLTAPPTAGKEGN